MHKNILLLSGLLLAMVSGCRHKIKQQEDEIYSRHLQAHMKLTVITTPMPDNKEDLNLLILNDGQDISQFRVKEIVDSLYRKKQLQPLLVVAVQPGDRMQDYGVAGYPDYHNNGSSAGKYSDFIADELYPFAKKKATVRKFKSVVIAGCSLGGLSAFDIAWDHADKIDKVGVFSGSFWVRDKDAAAPDYDDATDRLILNKIRSSHKRPHLQYWFYAGDKEEEGDRDKDGIIDVVDDTRDLMDAIKAKNVCSPGDISWSGDANGKHDYISWSRQLPNFLLWAFGK
ncbi:MAG: alpha/beta hydrolase-fold protein [Ferruginibacter sp.]